jgi:hypothetical protein
MSDATIAVFSPSQLADLHTTFLSKVLPRVMAHGRVYFRHVKCPDRKEELLAELRGLAWKWFVRLVRRGKDVLQFVSALATYAVRAVRSGRRVCGHEKSKDVLSPVAQRKHGFAVGKLPDFSTLSDNPLQEALHDNTVSPVPDQVVFRLDFPAWLATLGQRNREMAEDMALGYRTQDLAQKYRVSQGRISQMRRYFERDWSRFCGDTFPASPSLRPAVA